MTIENQIPDGDDCPAEEVLKLIAGKWKPQILRLATRNVLRFNTLLRQLPGSNKQAIAVALKDLDEAGLLIKNTIKLKPLHIEYSLSEKGKAIIPFLKGMEGFSESTCTAHLRKNPDSTDANKP